MHGLRRPEQTKQIKEIKAFLLFEVAAKSWESPTFQSTMKYPVSRTETKCQVPRAYARAPFL